MSRPTLLVCSEPLSRQMAGIGIRYVEMARELARRDLKVRLAAPFRSDDDYRFLVEQCAADGKSRDLSLVRIDEAGVGPALEDAQAVVAQGQLVNDVIHARPDLPLAVDLYDPWLVENLHYYESLGLDPYRNDHASWMLQLSAGDVFLCSSAEQRDFYSGLLVACGRVNPLRMQQDPSLDQLVRIVPFGVPHELPPHEPYLEPREPGEIRVLFGGLYDWYDPWPLLEGFQEVAAERDHLWRLLLVHNPSSDTPQELVRRVQDWVKRQSLDQSVRFLDWVPAARRFDLLRDVDLLASTHRDSLETRLSMRTRFLEGLAAGCPLLTTEGGSVSRMLVEHNAGWVVEEGSATAVAEALRNVADDQGEKDLRLSHARALAEDFHWPRVVEPLVEFCERPWRDETKADFAERLPTRAPVDRTGFRVKRRLAGMRRRFLVRDR